MADSLSLSCPNWEIGETWTLETYYADKAVSNDWKGPFYWEYTVSDIVSVANGEENEKYYVVNVKEKTTLNATGSLWYKLGSLCLNKIEIKSDISKKDDIDRTISYDQCGPVWTKRSLIPFDTPIFPLRIGSDENTKIKVDIGTGLKIVKNISQKTVAAENSEYSDMIEVVCEDSRTGELLFRQQWRSGLPWAFFGENGNIRYSMVQE